MIFFTIVRGPGFTEFRTQPVDTGLITIYIRPIISLNDLLVRDTSALSCNNKTLHWNLPCALNDNDHIPNSTIESEICFILSSLYKKNTFYAS